jgi:hypothetical protein
MKIQEKLKKMAKDATRELKKKETPLEKAPPKKRAPRTKHEHVWKIIGKTYAPPSNVNLQKLQNVSGASLEKAMFGVTTLLWECVCGETKKEELLGSDDDLLESLIDKAEKIGPQFVDRRGKRFIVSEWRQPVQDPNRIPVR